MFHIIRKFQLTIVVSISLATMTSHIPLVSCSSPPVVSSERVIKDEETISSINGVPIDYQYNETSFSTENALSSVPGCPKSIDGIPWVYYGTPPRCFFTGGDGPCDSGSVFLPQRGSLYGICLCSCFVDPDFDRYYKVETERYIECKEMNHDPTTGFGQIYDKQTQACYQLFGQGPCNSTSVVVGVKHNSLFCLPNCFWLRLDHKDIVGAKANGTCIDKTIPVSAVSAVLSVPKNECPEGQKYNRLLEKCVQRFPSIADGIIG